ncbi:MAG: two-component regulator propeller domain-containing protein [Bacteroidota bacterium]
MRTSTRYFFLAALLPLLHAVSQETHGEFVATSWGLEQGLPQSSVNAIIQTRDGYLWLGTFGGLVRFDGVQFTVFNRSNSPGMRSDRVLDVYEGSDGSIWCGTEEGLVRYRDGVFDTFNVVDSSRSTEVLKIREDSRGTLWLGTQLPIPARFQNGTPSQPFLAGATFTQRVLRDLREGKRLPDGIFLPGSASIFRTVGDSLVVLMNAPVPLFPFFRDVFPDPRVPDAFWVTTNGHGAIRYEKGVMRTYTVRDGLASNYVRKIFFDRDGTVWALSLDGVSRLDGERFHTPSGMRGSPGNDYTSMIQDHEGSYWIGTSAAGLQRFRRSVVSTYGFDHGLLQERILSLCLRKNGTLLVGTNCGGIYESRLSVSPEGPRSSSANLFSYSAMNRSLENNCIWSLFEDSRGAVWVGAMHLYRFERGSVTKFDSLNGFDGEPVYAVYEDRSGTIWVGCGNGLFRYDGSSFRHVTQSDGPAYNSVRSIFEDTDGALWVGTTNGLSVLRDGRWSSLPLEPLGRYVRAIHQDADGSMWFGTYGGGIVRLKERRMATVTTEQGLFDNIVSHIVEDAAGNFWMGSNAGIARVSKAGLNLVADGVDAKVEVYSLGVADGMKSVETNGGFQPSAVQDAFGRIYFPTVQGVAVVATRRVSLNDRPPPVHIERVLGADGDYSLRKPLVLPHDSATIEIRYTALSFVEPRKVRFRYILEGYDNDWVDAGGRRSAFYTHITPGEHRFRVVAANNDGVWNETGASLDIVVVPPFYMTWWFQSAMVLLFVSVGPAIYAWRVGAMKKEQRRQQEFSRRLIESQEYERRRIAAELHDGVGQEALVIRNRAMLAQRSAKRSKTLGRHLHEIADTAAEMVELIREIAHDLRPAHLERFGLKDTLTMNMEQVASSGEIKWTCRIDDLKSLLRKEDEINLYRIVQEAVQNVMKHSKASAAQVELRRTETSIIVSIRDNGRGFDSGAQEGKGGLGLATMRERARLLGGNIAITSRPGETRLELVLPRKEQAV